VRQGRECRWNCVPAGWSAVAINMAVNLGHLGEGGQQIGSRTEHALKPGRQSRRAIATAIEGEELAGLL
jgi:hypothetical protein